MKTLISRFAREERGAVLWMAAAAVTFLAVGTAFTADLGMGYVARAEAQRVADAAALAGAAALIETPGNVERARSAAAALAARNTVRRRVVALRPEDVEVSAGVVTVHVRRWIARGEGLPTTFGRFVGVNQIEVAARARARVAGANAATCLKPFIVPDMWHDTNANGRYDAGETYVPQVTGYGTDFRKDAFVRDVGRPVMLKPGSPSTSMVPGWYFLLRIPGNQGGDDVRRTIASTECNQTVLYYGDERQADQETGAKKGPVRQGINDLIALDPNAYWDATTRTVRGSVMGDAWRASPRMMNIALFDPTQPVEPGNRPIRITNFATLFLERTQGDDIIGRFITTIGLALGEGDCEAQNRCAPFAATVRLAD